MTDQPRKMTNHSSKKPATNTHGSSAYDRLLKGEITSKEYVQSLRRAARERRPVGLRRRARGSAA